MLNTGIIQSYDSPYVSPLHLVPQSNSNMFRICVDFRRLNASMTALHNCILGLQDMAIYSKLNITKAYYPISVTDEYIPRISVTKVFGLFNVLTNGFWSEKCCPNFTLPHRQHIMIAVHVYAPIKDVLIAR